SVMTRVGNLRYDFVHRPEWCLWRLAPTRRCASAFWNLDLVFLWSLTLGTWGLPNGLAADAKEVAELGKLRRSVKSARAKVLYVVLAEPASGGTIGRSADVTLCHYPHL